MMVGETAEMFLLLLCWTKGVQDYRLVSRFGRWQSAAFMPIITLPFPNANTPFTYATSQPIDHLPL
jgi:hypothetical protein